MRSLRFRRGVWATGLLLLGVLAFPGDARAANDVYEHLKWEFSIPVKLKNMLSEAWRVYITVRVLDQNGGEIVKTVGAVDIPQDGSDVDTVYEIALDPPADKDPMSARKYTVDMAFHNHVKPSFNNPTLAHRAKEGTELVHHIEGEMRMPAAEAEGGGYGNVGAGVQ